MPDSAVANIQKIVSQPGFQLDSKVELDLNESNHEISDDSDVDDEYDTPLAVIAKKTKTDIFNKFYTALLNFKNHFVEEHIKNVKTTSNYPDFTDSCESDTSVRPSSDNIEEERIDKFDDLSVMNKRKDKMSEETRQELTEVKTKINGKTYYTCKLCNKNLSSTHTYIFHKRIHTGERPCICHICGKQFRVPNTLHRHLTETHQGLRRHLCTICNKTFVNSQNLKHHLRIHTGERPYVCTLCGKRFTQSGALHIHMKMHSEEYPFKCVECGSKFKIKSELARHGLKHTGERPHGCFHCPKSFKTKYQLNVHAAAHAGVKPYSCASCVISFATRRALRRHMKRIHEPPVSTPITFNHY